MTDPYRTNVPATLARAQQLNEHLDEMVPPGDQAVGTLVVALASRLAEEADTEARLIRRIESIARSLETATRTVFRRKRLDSSNNSCLT